MKTILENSGFQWEDGPTTGAPLWGHNGRRGTPTNLTIKTQTSSSSVESTVPNKSENSLLSCHVYLINMQSTTSRARHVSIDLARASYGTSVVAECNA